MGIPESSGGGAELVSLSSFNIRRLWCLRPSQPSGPVLAPVCQNTQFSLPDPPRGRDVEWHPVTSSVPCPREHPAHGERRAAPDGRAHLHSALVAYLLLTRVPGSAWSTPLVLGARAP